MLDFLKTLNALEIFLYGIFFVMSLGIVCSMIVDIFESFNNCKNEEDDEEGTE